MTAPARRCAYCGAPPAAQLTVSGLVVLVTCWNCADLPALDPAYGLAATIARGTYPALSLEDRAPSAAARLGSLPPGSVV